MTDTPVTDLFIIGGGINGCGIARDAAGRGLSVTLAEMNDLASATSSASTKLFHGGLRYLEYFEFRLVREALIEREVLLKAMPHISWPMRFVLPFHKDMRFDSETPTSKLLTTFMPWMKGRRPAWLIRLGLFLYDSLGKRGILPGTAKLDLEADPAGRPLRDKFKTAFEYSDCWIEDARLVVLNARDAQARGAEILTRTKVLAAERHADHWVITLQDQASGETHQRRAKMLINAGGPWVADVLHQKLGQNSRENIRLVRGSHIVVPKLFDHGRCYFFQGTDGRIIFAIPYEEDFTLIGTTDSDHSDPDTAPEYTTEEQDYLIDFASGYFNQPLKREDIVWTYSGVRPLYDDGASSATAATREYVLTLDQAQAPLLNVFGGKITTYRKLAEAALAKIGKVFPQLPADWTAGVALPGGDFAVADVEKLRTKLAADYPFLTPYWTRRLIRAYGTEAWAVLGEAKSAADMGQDFGATITARELDWAIAREWVRTGDDYLWRRTKLGLRLDEAQRAAVDAYIQGKAAQLAA
ncbi:MULTISPECIES: glycerol-3-phosphate dehydrogenase [unclassified Leisingera]|uniref:glycerol-3-phosphate dehydrogenase n=1 Tax=unclassified Leisingera TaxID=2614906 RepID=UPI0002ED3A89|nr:MULTISPECIES: glycerol-3-phosphate dehydrogenase [unclassified Leisingera]KIC26085.1 glycerol-3-phosphate dehydrogenase [Leisingera sp. ANG-S3]KIC53188.1 glycerol-3-phosphate dehydrogenase [Leisingera sp. ANG-S]KID08363.1 glycerol-3-phosphate dehydrogenase [Leisingera sp. ANG1]